MMREYIGRVINSRPSKMSPQSLVERMDFAKKKWKHILTTNCYAYALGLDIPERKIKSFAYVPGTIGNGKSNLFMQRVFTMKELMDNIADDLVSLGINFEECNPDYKTEYNEWKIAIFTSYYSYILLDEYFYDFHFLREREDGTWYHKRGYKHSPNNMDSNKNLILDPRTCYLKNYDYQLTYKLRKNK